MNFRKCAIYLFIVIYFRRTLFKYFLYLRYELKMQFSAYQEKRLQELECKIYFIFTARAYLKTA